MDKLKRIKKSKDIDRKLIMTSDKRQDHNKGGRSISKITSLALEEKAFY